MPTENVLGRFGLINQVMILGNIYKIIVLMFGSVFVFWCRLAGYTSFVVS